jgi:hypothetical protein
MRLNLALFRSHDTLAMHWNRLGSCLNWPKMLPFGARKVISAETGARPKAQKIEISRKQIEGTRCHRPVD